MTATRQFEIEEIASSFYNFDGYVGCVCKICGASNNVIESVIGFWCGCGFFNRGATGKALPFRNPTYTEDFPEMDRITDEIYELHPKYYAFR